MKISKPRKVSLDKKSLKKVKLFCTSNMVIVNACLSYFDFRLPSELLLKK